VVVGRVVAPPARPLLVAPGAAADRAEHVPAHHPSADVLARFLDDPCALVHLASLRAMGFAPSGPRSAFFVFTLASVHGLRFALPICTRAIPEPATWKVS